MDRFNVTDEGGGIIRVDAETRLMRPPLAHAICDEVERLTASYDSFKILMNMGAISKGTPSAGLYTLRQMKKYDMTALALFKANGFMRNMATVVLGLARFRNFALFDDEADARKWLERADSEAPAMRPPRRVAPALLALAGSGAAAWVVRRRRSRS